jgi:acetyl-CoA carboxylase biotin carboxyl carrier protein
VARRREPASPRPAPASDVATIRHLADDMLPLLIDRLAESSLGELEVRHNGWRVRLRRPSGVNGRRAQPDGPPVRDEGHSTAQGQAAPATATADAGRQPARPAGDRSRVTSTAVGYYSPRDGVGVGSRVQQGDVIGHVDVLGVRQEVVTPADGVLRRLEVEPGEAVEYGQLIARIEPETRS